MIKYKDMIIFTLVIDLCLIYIYNTSKLNNFDKINVLTLFFVHLVFYISLLNKYNLLLDISHMFFIAQVNIVSLFTTNIKILMLYIFIILVMLYYWFRDNKCPLGQFERFKQINNFLIRNEKLTYVSPFLILPILLYKIYKKSN